MSIAIDSQPKPCAADSLAGPASPAMRSSPAPPTPDSVAVNPMRRWMMEHLSEHGFLKLLISQDATPEASRLRYRLSQTTRDERCIRRAIFVVAVLFLLSPVGLSYCAILAPELLSDSRYHVLQGLAGLGLGALSSLVVFLGYLLWHRATVSRLHRECRLWILAKPQLMEGAAAIVSAGFSGTAPGGLDGLPAQQPGMPPGSITQ